LTTEGAHILEASEKHLLFVKKTNENKFIFAKDVHVGDMLYNAEISKWLEVTQKKMVERVGYLAPLSR